MSAWDPEDIAKIQQAKDLEFAHQEGRYCQREDWAPLLGAMADMLEEIERNELPLRTATRLRVELALARAKGEA